MRKRKLLVPVLLAFAALASCMKYETYPVPEKPNGCKVSKMYLYGGGGAGNDTATFTWTGNNITAVALNAFRYNVDYDGALVTKRTFFQGNSTTPFRYDQFIYNPAANYIITRYELFEADTSGAFYRSDSTVFQYSGNALTSFTQYERSAANMPMEIRKKKQLSYVASNLSLLTNINYMNAVATDTTSATISVYAEPNHFRAINDHFWMVNPLWVADDMDVVQFALTQDAIAQIAAGGQSSVRTYVSDDKGNLSEYRESGVLQARFQYNCP
jgi:hypothetical protein